MADTKINVELDPKKAIDPILELIDVIKKLADAVENHLGKEAPKSIVKMEEAAERGTSRIKGFFSDLKKRLQDDLKTAFDVGKFAAGLNLADQLGSGIKEVFNLERAFDKLNSRLQLTGKAYQDFKQQIGTSVAKTGQKLEDVFPGVEVAASKGNIKSSKDLSMIAEDLSKVKATTGENTESLSETIISILKDQGKKITGESFRETLNAIQGTRTSGSFKNANDAANAIKGITHILNPEQMKAMGLDTRQMGGLASVASSAGSQGQEILQHILKTAIEAGGKEKLNAILGADLFKNGKLDVSAFGKIDKKRFGQYSEQALSGALGADQSGLSRFLDSMKTGMENFKKVTSGSNETTSQFETATDNLASGIDRFKEKSKNLVRSVGDDLSQSANEMLKGNFKSDFKKSFDELLHLNLSGSMGALFQGKSGENLKHAAGILSDNKGLVAGIGGTALAATLLTGGGLNKLLKKVPGGGKISGMVGGEIAKATGVTPVYVTNASEIGAGLSNIAGIAGGGIGGGLKQLGVLGVGAAAFETGKALADNETISKMISPILDSVTNPVFKSLGIGSGELETTNKGNSLIGNNSNDHIVSAIAKGTEQGVIQAKRNQKTQYTNPSNPQSRGGHM